MDEKKAVLPACLLKTIGGKKAMDRKPDDDSNDEDDEMQQTPDDKLTAAAARLINTHVSLIPDKGGADGTLAEAIAATKAGSYLLKDTGTPIGKGSVMMIVDPANMTESSSHQHLRMAQVSQALVDRAVNAGSLARQIARTNNKEMGDDTLLQGEDLWVIFDGGRAIETGLMTPFRRAANKQKIQVTIMYDEDSILTNIGRVTTINSLKCTESMFLIASAEWTVPRRSHAHYRGSNYSDMIGPVIKENWEDDTCWKLSRKEKKQLMGRFKVDVGGSVDQGLSSTSKWKTRDQEPVWFFSKSNVFLDNLIHSFLAKSVVDFSPSHGQMAMVAMRRRLPYVGDHWFHIDIVAG